MFLPFFHVIDSGDSIIIEFECDCPANRDDEPFFDYVDFVVYFSFRDYELRLRLPIPLLFDGTEEVTSLQSQSSVITSLRLFKVNPDNSLPHETLEELKIFSRDYNYNTQPVLGTARNIVSPCEADARDALIGMDFMCVPTIDTTGTMNDGQIIYRVGNTAVLVNDINVESEMTPLIDILSQLSVTKTEEKQAQELLQRCQPSGFLLGRRGVLASSHQAYQIVKFFSHEGRCLPLDPPNETRLMKRIEEEDEVLCQIGETEDEGEISWVNATTRVDIQSIAAELAGQVQQIEGPICLPGISSDDAKTRVRDISRALKQGHYFDSPIRNASAMGEAAAATLIEVMAAICHVLISVRAENDMVDEVGGTVPSSGRATLQSWSGTAYSVCMTCTSLSWLDCPPTIEVAAQSFLRRSVAYSVDSSYKVGIMSLELLNYILNGLQPRKSAQWMLSLFVATMAEQLNEAVHELFRGALLDDLFVYASVVTDDSYRYYAKRIEEFLRRTCGSE